MWITGKNYGSTGVLADNWLDSQGEVFNVLISTPSPEKDSLLGPMVHKKIARQILKKEAFFGQPFSI